MPAKNPLKDPFDWLLRACVMVLVAALAVTWAVSLLSAIWPWLVGFGLVGLGVWWWNRRRTRW